MIQVEKKVYEAVLRNSLRVNDLEVENQRLKDNIRYGFAVDDVVMERMDKLRAENQQLKELLKLCKESIENYRSGKKHNFTADNIVRMIDNAIGENNNG